MRIQLAAAVALAPLMLASGAAAQTVINNERTTPVSTSTVNNGAPDAIQITNGGLIRVGSGTALTIDSSHDVTMETGSRITMENAADGSTAILVLGGNTSDITLGGVISVTDNFVPADSDNDGDLDGPFAMGTGRYGLRLTGPGALTGDILLTSSITVEGNQSAGVSLESDLIGDLTAYGNINIQGTDSYGLRVTGGIDGDAYVGGQIDALGENVVGASMEGDITGRLTIGGRITASGFRYTGALNDSAIENLDADDLLIGGPALSISGNVAGGVLFDIPHFNDPDDDDDDDDGVPDTEDTDDDNNGIPDVEETGSSVTSYGDAPAVQIGSMTDTVTLGLVGTGDEAFGLINRGSILASGLYEGISATGLRIGLEGGQDVIIEGGVSNSGGVTSLAVEADARAIILASGSQIDIFDNSGTIRTLSTSEGAFEAVGMDIEAGALLPSLLNGGDITAIVNGETANAYAVRDASGTLSSLTNTGIIEAYVRANDDADDDDDDNTDAGDEVITGRAVAIDVSANTGGVTLIQNGVDDGDDLDDEIDDPDIDEDGVDDDDEPMIIGDVLLGSGDDVVEIRNGLVNGSVEFGLGADSFLIDGGAEVSGILTDTDGLLDINLVDGVLDARQPDALTISNLDVGAEGNLIVTIDPTAGTSGGFNVTGTANIASGAGLGVRFSSLLADPTRFVIIEAGTLNAGTIDQSRIQENSPYMYVVNAGVDDALNQVYIDARQRTTEEFGFIASETAAYGAFYEALAGDPTLMAIFLSQTERDEFFDLYEQMLPDHSGGALISLASGVDAVTRGLSGRGYPAAEGETSAWLQEINFYADQERGEAYGFRSEGFGFAGGIERGTGFGALGLSFALTSSDLEDPEAEAEEILSAQLLELGLYWRAQGVHWNVWARGAAGFASFDSVRQLVGVGINLRNESDWNGYSLALAAGAAYDYQVGRWSIRPEAIVEYFSLNEDAHEESGGGDGFDLGFDDRSGHIFSSTVAVTIGAGFGENRWLRPEIRLGWRQIFSHDPGVTTARFLSTGTPFELEGNNLEGGGPVVGFRLNLGNELGFLALEGDAELLDNYVRYALLLRASFKF